MTQNLLSARNWMMFHNITYTAAKRGGQPIVTNVLDISVSVRRKSVSNLTWTWYGIGTVTYASVLSLQKFRIQFPRRGGA